MKKYDVLIIGGGASGVFLSLLLKDHGLNVAILERKDRILKKLLATGNGRCNISNINVMDEIKEKYTSHNKTYDFAPLYNYSLNETLDYFKSLGIYTTILEDGKMYPLSLQASSVVDLFRLALEEKNIPVFLNTKIIDIKNKNDVFYISSNEEEFISDKLVISTGGSAMPSSGSDGSFYTILKSLGFDIINPSPALVQLKLESNNLRALSGVKFEGEAILKSNGKEIKKDKGEILFTNYGASGPPILQLSRFINNDLLATDLELVLDLFPEKSHSEIKEFILNHIGMFNYRESQDVFKGILNSRLIPILLKESGIYKASTIAYDVPFENFNNLIDKLKHWDFKIIGTQHFNMAQGTLGGVNLNNLTKNLESKNISKLYFTGEVIDVLGASGGYNLQWAWSSAGTVMKDIINKITY